MEREMSEDELRALIKESLSEVQLSAEDEAYDEVDFEDSLETDDEEYYGNDINIGLDDIDEVPLSSVDMPIRDKAVFSQGGNQSYDDEFSDLNGYKEFGDGTDDYEGNWQDDVSVSPGYFNEQELAKMIREGVKRLHRKTLVENRLEQINQELNALNNPQVWENARTEAQNQLKKKHIAWQEITTRENLMSEASMMQKMKAKLKGVDAEQRAYNEKNNLPLDWNGTKEGYHEYITNKKHSSGSN